MGSSSRRLLNQSSLAPRFSSQAISDALHASVISNCTGRPVFCCTTIQRDRTLRPIVTSAILSLMRSHPPNLLSRPRSKIAKSRTRFAICRMTCSPNGTIQKQGRFSQLAWSCLTCLVVLIELSLRMLSQQCHCNHYRYRDSQSPDGIVNHRVKRGEPWEHHQRNCR
jgi:hypothetical protein